MYSLILVHTLTLSQVSIDECFAGLEKAKVEAAQGIVNYDLLRWEYIVCKYIREDNTPEMGKYLGYLDAQELYPDFKPISFSEFIDELLAGKAKRPYADEH